MKPPLLFAHGWGYDRSVWDPVVALLPGRHVFRVESGYLGAVPAWPEVPEGTVLIGHSAGVLSLLQHGVPAGCAGLVSVNGFTRFVAAEGFPGVPERVPARMQRQFAAAPDSMLRAFRLRCGDACAPADRVDAAALAAGLHVLREEDARGAFAMFAGPVLALAALDDPIVSPAHARACFVAEQLRWSPSGGHLLPLTRPHWCAALIGALAC